MVLVVYDVVFVGGVFVDEGIDDICIGCVVVFILDVFVVVVE